MSLSNILIKVAGIVLLIVGLALLLALVGLNFLGVSFPGHWLLQLIVGVIFFGAGIYVIRGGTFTL